MDRELITRPETMDRLGPAGFGDPFNGLFADLQGPILLVGGVFLLLSLLGLAIRVTRRARIARLYRRREALEARLAEVKHAPAAAAPRPTDAVACHFCREDIHAAAIVCRHCTRPALHNLKAFVAAARAARAEAAGTGVHSTPPEVS